LYKKERHKTAKFAQKTAVSDRQSYIKIRRPLFWSVADEKLADISDELLVETILNYGSLEDVRELIALLGLRQTAGIFFRGSEGRQRQNYFPEVANFFRLYFHRHVPQHSV
jgi:hypothetical protein